MHKSVGADRMLSSTDSDVRQCQGKGGRDREIEKGERGGGLTIHWLINAFEPPGAQMRDVHL